MTVLVEAPLARMILAGMERGRAVGTIRRLATCELARDEARGITGSRIEVHEDGDDVHVQCVFALREATVDPDGAVRDDGIYWDNQGVVARGHAIPEAAAAIAAGMPMDALIGHPLLADLHVADAVNDEDGVLVVGASDSLWTLRMIEERI